MADISQPAAIGAMLPADKHGQQRKRRNEEKAKPPEVAGSHDVADVTDVMGIPLAEATPKVQETLNVIMAEFDKARIDLEHARAHIAYLEELADRHPVLPLINRRGLHRELSRTLALATRAGVTNSFLCFHIGGIEEIGSGQGREAAEAILIAVAEMLRALVRETDVVGSLGGGDFGVILTIADDESASDKAISMAQALRGVKVGADDQIRVDFGQHTFCAGDSAETVLQAADQDLRARSTR